MLLFLYIEYYLWVGFVGIFVLACLAALIDVLLRPAAVFLGSGTRTKGYWIGFTAAALVVALLCLPGIGGGLMRQFFIVFPAVIAIWYFGSIRPQLPRLRRGGLGGPGGPGGRGFGPGGNNRGTW